MNNILKKVSVLRKEFRTLGIKPTGYNKHQNFKYYEISDFIGRTMDLLNILKMVTIEQADRELYTLKVYDIESGEHIEFSVPFEKSTNIKDQVQASGAGLTYCKRYVYTNLLALDEKDQLDGQDTTPKPQNAVREQITHPVTQPEYNEPNREDVEVLSCSCGGILEPQFYQGNPWLTKAGDKHKHKCESCQYTQWVEYNG